MRQRASTCPLRPAGRESDRSPGGAARGRGRSSPAQDLAPARCPAQHHRRLPLTPLPNAFTATFSSRVGAGRAPSRLCARGLGLDLGRPTAGAAGPHGGDGHLVPTGPGSSCRPRGDQSAGLVRCHSLAAEGSETPVVPDAQGARPGCLPGLTDRSSWESWVTGGLSACPPRGTTLPRAPCPEPPSSRLCRGHGGPLAPPTIPSQAQPSVPGVPGTVLILSRKNPKPDTGTSVSRSGARKGGAEVAGRVA